MKRYEVEIIHEPSGEYLNYSFESDDEDLDIYKEFIRDISVVVISEEEVEEDDPDELDTAFTV